MNAEAPRCPTCGRPLTMPVKAYRAQRLKLDAAPGCRVCRYIRRLPIPLEGNRLGRVLYERIRYEGSSLDGWAQAHAIPGTTVRQILKGERRYLAIRTIERLATALVLSVQAVQAMVPGTMEEKHSEQGLALGQRAWTDEDRRRHRDAQRRRRPDTRKFNLIWLAINKARSADGRIREELLDVKQRAYLQRIRTALAKTDPNDPEARALRAYKQYLQRHQGVSVTSAIVDQWASRTAKRYGKIGLPRLYVRYKFYEFANLKWPGPHPRSLGHRPDVKRFELVYPLKRQGKTERQIAQFLSIDYQTFHRWWTRFWSR